jgi:hypothetical protein
MRILRIVEEDNTKSEKLDRERQDDNTLVLLLALSSITMLDGSAVGAKVTIQQIVRIEVRQT